MKKKTLFETAIEQQDQYLSTYCKRLGWDKERLRRALTDTGVFDLSLYLENPTTHLIGSIGDFIVHAENSLYVIYGPHGYGKTSFRNYIIKALATSQKVAANYFFIRIDDPGLVTHVQVLREVLQGIGVKKVPRNLGDVKSILIPELQYAREHGISTVVWVDEGQKLTADMISLLRTLSDIQTNDGCKVCKIIITGTPLLSEKLDLFERKRPEDIAAFRERLALNRTTLIPWSAEDIEMWWHHLVENVGGTTSPFVEKGAAKTMYELTQGVPRSIVQLTRYSLNYAAAQQITSITGDVITQAFKERLHYG